MPDVRSTVRYEPRCSFPTYLFRRNWDILNDPFQFGPYLGSPFGRSPLLDPYYGSPYTRPTIWTYYTPPSSFASNPRRYYDYDHKMGALNSTYLPRYVYYPAYSYNMDYYFKPRARLSEKSSDPNQAKNNKGENKKGSIRRPRAEIEKPSKPAIVTPTYDGYYSKPYRTYKLDHLSDSIERSYRSYDREPYSSLDSYRLSNDLYWERRFKNFESRQQYTWSRDRSLLPPKLSSFDQWHVYGRFQPRRESFTAKYAGSSSGQARSPSLSAVHVSM
uniref:Uncharacterized protein n=1 Tax=Plectus sambesii TaxID=2011161 RepID=A0A914X0H2_9BILA